MTHDDIFADLRVPNSEDTRPAKPTKPKREKKVTLPRPVEDAECEAFVQWMRLRNLKFGHIANENKVTSRKMAAILGQKRWRQGVSPGVPDYLIVFGSKLLFIEMKRQRSVPSDVSPEQRSWLAALGRVPGVTVAVCSGADDAIATVRRTFGI